MRRLHLLRNAVLLLGWWIMAAIPGSLFGQLQNMPPELALAVAVLVSFILFLAVFCNEKS